MKLIVSLLTLSAAFTGAVAAISPERQANTVVLDKQRAENLGIETVEAQKADFEQTFFALGRIAVIPSKRGVVSSRIPGRIVELRAYEGEQVIAGQSAVVIESRQPGNPPPRVTLKTPLAGMVMKTHASLGEPVEPDTAILEINDLREVHAVANVPESQAGRIKVGTRARITIAAFPDETFEGELLRFGTAADAGSGTIDAVFLLRDLDGRVRPNMRAEFSVITSTRKDVTAIPLEALQGDSTNPYVFVKDFQLDYAYVKTPLRLGERNDHVVEVLGGLFPADEIVTTGAYPLAFAGAGSISLKEALDAAHGHEHNEDGSEMTAEQRRAKQAEKTGGAGGGGDGGPLTIFLAALSGLLAVLLLLSVTVFRRKHPKEEAPTDA